MRLIRLSPIVAPRVAAMLAVAVAAQAALGQALDAGNATQSLPGAVASEAMPAAQPTTTAEPEAEPPTATEAMVPATGAIRQAAGAIREMETLFRVGSEPVEMDPVHQELRTMSKVMEKMLDRSGLEDWREIPAGFSSFNPVISAQYIPTVGAIFTVPVSFFIVGPDEAGDGEEPAPDAEDDLWTEAMNEGRVGRVSATRALKSSTKRQGLALPSAAVPAQRPRLHEVSVVVNAEYDEAKVTKLRETLESALRDYGHRLEHVDETERVLVIVEAPRPGGSGGGLPVEATSGNPEEAANVFLLHTLTMSPKGGGKDRLLLSVDKKDVLDPAGDFAARVKKVRY